MDSGFNLHVALTLRPHSPYCMLKKLSSWLRSFPYSVCLSVVVSAAANTERWLKLFRFSVGGLVAASVQS